MNKPRISIIGPGRVGKALMRVFSQKKYQVLSVFHHKPISESIVSLYPDTHFEMELPADEEEIGEITFITTSDNVIPEVAKELAEKMESLVGKYVVHCSGTFGSDVLKPLKSKGAKVACFHPMKAVTPQTEDFKEIWFDLEGDEVVVSVLEHIADELGGHALRVNAKDKKLLHLSATIASNYLVVLADLAASVSDSGNINKSKILEVLLSLMENTTANISDIGIEEALTGPIARGDLATIESHIKTLQKFPDILEIYKILGRKALNIVERNSDITQDHLKIKKILA
ncbi:MAG: DUF2520 domain-containing protein [Gracilimonas sp.]|nr:DUF2520 domain-containing protein [Gracilimonas sp.]